MNKSSVFSILKMLHLAMLAGQIIFTAVIFYLIYSNVMQPMFVEHEKILQIIAIIIVAFSFLQETGYLKKAPGIKR
jgi:hypothetical protein